MRVDWSKVHYFIRGEFTCHCGCEREEMDAQFVYKLDLLRHDMGQPFRVLSGFRCPQHNNIVSTTGENGPHTLGLAADIQASGEFAYHLLDAAMGAGFLGIGVKQKGEMGARFLHLDMVTGALRPRIWSY